MNNFDNCWVLRWYKAFEQEIGCGFCSIHNSELGWFFRWSSPKGISDRKYGFSIALTKHDTLYASSPEEYARTMASSVRNQWGGELDTVSRM